MKTNLRISTTRSYGFTTAAATGKYKMEIPERGI